MLVKNPKISSPETVLQRKTPRFGEENGELGFLGLDGRRFGRGRDIEIGRALVRRKRLGFKIEKRIELGFVIV